MGDILAEDDIAGLPVGNFGERKVLLDNEVTRITYYVFGPGEENPWHAHPYDFVVVYFDDGNLESMLTDGSTTTLQGKSNTSYRVPAGTRHRAKNNGDKPVRLVEVEYKTTDIRKGAGLAAGGSKTAVPNVLELIPQLMDKLRTALAGRDRDRLGELLAESLTFTHSQAEHDTCSTLLDRIGGGGGYANLEFVDVQVMSPSAEAAISTGTMRGSLIGCSGRDAEARFTATWLRDRGVWRLVAFQATPRAGGL